MFERFKKWIDGPEPRKINIPEPQTTPKVRAKRGPAAPAKAAPVALSAKEKATMAGEPYVNILSMEVDPNNINNGAFELDWNDKFLLNLIKSGYKKRDDDTENVIVDRWFHDVCRNVVLELYEQDQADPDRRDAPPLTKSITEVEERIIVAKDIGNGRSEVS